MTVQFVLLPDNLHGAPEVLNVIQWDDRYGPLPRLGEAVIFDGEREGEAKTLIVSSIGHDLRTGVLMYHREVTIGLLSPKAASGVLSGIREGEPL